ncbi:MAG TPA: hypothetical protein PKC83_16190 [Gemmatimonadaceae bacterium]|nr:hypothetical protein [Gemmatimonadaceae bacterium]
MRLPTLRRHSLALLVMAVTIPSVGAAQSSGASTEQRKIRWSGNFTPVQVRSSNVAMRIQSRIYGTVSLTSADGAPERTRVRLSFTSQSGGNSFTVQWALVPGRCGSGGLPALPIDNFPMIEVGSDGRAQLDTELSLSLPESGEYHVNVYSGGQELSNVITCANLKK